MHARTPVLLLLLLLIVISPVSAFQLRQLSIAIDRSGDAIITADYQENPVEYLSVKAASDTVLRDQLVRKINRDASVICTDYGVSMVKVGKFAEVHGNRFETPQIDLSGAVAPVPKGYPLEVAPDVTIIFPDGYFVQQKSAAVIQPVTHTLGKYSGPPAPQPADQCRAKKTLPVSGIIPDQLIPVAAVGAGVAMTGLGLSTLGSLFSSGFAHLIAFLQNLIGGLFAGKVADKSKEKRGDTPAGPSGGTGITKKELLVLAAGAAIIGILFLYAARNPFNPLLIGIYIVMGGLALSAHELAHWYLNKKYHGRTEVQFWGLGTVIMLVTSALFGTVFAQPTLTVVRSETPLGKRETGLIMLAGPLLSIAFALCCLLLLPLGGLLRTAGAIGFSINLLVGVFEMLPIAPCEGKEVYHWNKIVWALLFIPMMAVYLVVSV